MQTYYHHILTNLKYNMNRLFLFMTVAVLLGACANKGGKNSITIGISVKNDNSLKIKEGDVMAGVNLTVAESKRLIAKGIANHPQVKKKLTKGMVIITSGTTNTYIAEELANLDAPRGSFMTGNITPKHIGNVAEGLTRVPNIVLIDGQKADISFDDALEQISEGDIIFKGANLLNYEEKQVAVCIGAATGGTTSRIRPFTTEGKGRLIVPVGLEKQVYGNLNDYEKLFENEVEKLSNVPRVWVHHNAEIFTEIEAIKALADVNIAPFAAGGIAGSEGGISLAIYGSKENVQKVLDIISEIQGEEPFIQ